MFKRALDLALSLYARYKEAILYLFFGGLTTLVNIVSYAAFARVLKMDVVAGTVLAWIVSVVFAYATNKTFVFESRTHGILEFLRESLSFFGCRLATGVMDVAIMYVSVDVMGLNDILMKIASNVLVVILNYVFSKLLIFRRAS